MKALLIGVNGLLGRTLARLLQAQAITYDEIFHENTENIPHNPKGNRFSIYQAKNLKNEYTHVFLLSAFIPYGALDTPHPLFNKTNIEIPLWCTNAFPSARIVFASSVSVYGKSEGCIHEESPFTQPNLYGLSKLSSESILLNHPSYAILRFSSILGEGMNSKTFIPSILRSAIRSNTMTLYGNGERTQDYISVSFAAALCLKAALSTENLVLNGVRGHSYSNTQIARYIQEILPSLDIVYKGEDFSPSYNYSAEKLKKVLGIEENLSIQHILKTLLTYYQSEL